MKGLRRPGLARLNADGSPDATFNAGTTIGETGGVVTIALQADGRMIVAGDFRDDLVNRSRIVRLHPDGRHDDSFNVGTGPDAGIHIVFVQPDGKVLVVGSFRSFNGVGALGIVRLTSNGSVDPTFNAGLSFDGAILAAALQPDGRILAR